MACSIAGRIVLLDLNFTLVENSRDWKGNYPATIAAEKYRRWLVDFLREERVLLVTVRHKKHERQTLARIAAECNGWSPEASYFRTNSDDPPTWKLHVLQDMLYPLHGADPAGYVAIESNPKTRAMYAAHRIEAWRQEDIANGPQ